MTHASALPGADIQLLSLPGLHLPENGALRREPPPGAMRLGPDNVERFDDRTLFYDAFRVVQGGPVTLVGPRLRNLWPVIRAGLRVDGSPARRIRRRRFHRHEELSVAAPAGAALSIKIDGMALPIPVALDDGGTFAGRNCLVTILKDEPLEWIAGWARYHVSAHGVGGILIFDNGSNDPGPEAMAEALAQIPGLAVARIVTAPFPYGCAVKGRFAEPAKYLQTGLLNLARRRFFRRAAGVVFADIDEMVWPVEGADIFARAAAARFGLVTYKGQRLYPEATEAAAPQRAHGWSRNQDRIRSPKWCLIPGRGGDWAGWAVHRPGGLAFPFSQDRTLGFWHCERTSRNWKGGRRGAVTGLKPDTAAQRAFAAHLDGSDR